MAVNPLEMMKMGERLRLFSQQHPRFGAFLKDVSEHAIAPGTIVEMKVTGPDGRKGGSASSGTKTGDPNGTNLMLAVIGLGAGLSGLAMAVRSRRKRGRA